MSDLRKKRIWAYVAPLVGVLLLAGCTESKDVQKPWSGYATSKKEDRKEWWFSNFERYSDCVYTMKTQANSKPQNEWYREPVGCGYKGQYFLDVYFRNYFALGSEFACVARVIETSGNKYVPILKDHPTSGDGWYCPTLMELLW